jgi:hypothetical protein
MVAETAGNVTDIRQSFETEPKTRYQDKTEINFNQYDYLIYVTDV